MRDGPNRPLWMRFTGGYPLDNNVANAIMRNTSWKPHRNNGTNRNNSLQMAAKKAGSAPAVAFNAVDGLVGYDIETGGVFDPLNFGKNCPPEQMQWYRAAELKHGRVCMLAALGQITQHFTHWNDPSGIFDKSGSAWGAMQQVRDGMLDYSGLIINRLARQLFNTRSGAAFSILPPTPTRSQNWPGTSCATEP